MDEFELIEHYFKRRARPRDDVRIGIGDDAAIVQLEADVELAVSVDTLVAGVHFPAAMSADDLGHRALAVNLSDLAAMGARPRWALLALTLPAIEPAWLDRFSNGFFALAAAHEVALIGGNVTQGPCAISITIMGSCARGTALTRSGARPGDGIYVTGTLGDAALALRLEPERTDAPARWIRARYERPTPRVAVGQALIGIANAAIDISDGLLGDLGHVLRASHAGARIEGRSLPLSPAAIELFGRDRAFTAAATGGDDYELLFTAAPEAAPEIARRLRVIDCAVTRIGEVHAGEELHVTGLEGKPVHFPHVGYRHFDC